MRKLNVALLTLLLPLAGLATDELTKSDLIGTWQVDEGATTPAVEIFLPDGNYCSYAAPDSKQPYSRGTWTLGPHGSVALRISSSEDPWEMSHSNLGLLRRARLAPRGRLQIGLSCDHCPGGMWEIPTSVQISSASPARGSMSPNKSFKPNPLRGSA
jgi:hypothetical protein